MREAAATLALHKTLRVFVQADDPARRTALCRVISNGGHELAESSDAADVVLADGDAASGGSPIVVLGGADDDQAGLLPRDASPDQIDAALRGAAAGLIVRQAKDTTPAFGELQERNLQSLLTPRETEVLSAIADGLGNKEIARRLEISLHTVKFHIESLLRKLGARSRAEAVAKGLARRKRESIEL
jgi:DNA-binding NarL/FixJ family response regulator